MLNEKINLVANESLVNSRHAKLREDQRGITEKQITLAFQYGRIIHARRATYYVVGKKEIDKHSAVEPALKEMNGIHLVVSSNGTLLTVYKNKDLRKIRPSKHRHKHLH
tara:strand:+ start:426 stop:752 length:327 start_codon:yes stop_codon:yes gene_type:complete